MNNCMRSMAARSQILPTFSLLSALQTGPSLALTNVEVQSEVAWDRYSRTNWRFESHV